MRNKSFTWSKWMNGGCRDVGAMGYWMTIGIFSLARQDGSFARGKGDVVAMVTGWTADFVLWQVQIRDASSLALYGVSQSIA